MSKKLNQIRGFFREYRLLSFVLITTLTGGIFAILDKTTLANVLLGSASVVALIPLIWNMVEEVRTGRYGIDILAATAIITSLLLKEYWAAVVIVIMLTGGKALEDYAERRAKTELSALLERKPHTAHMIRGHKVVDVSVNDVSANEKLVIMPGEVIPADATIIEGSTNVDESSLTGESIPLEKTIGDQLMSGAINIDGTITVQTLRSPKDSQYEQIIKLVRSAANANSPFVRLADAYSIPFTIVSFLIAGLVWFVTGDPMRFLQVLVVATPCPLLLAAPIALISGMSRAAKHGIIIKSGTVLEKLAAAKTFAFDKTGTLTIGKPSVSGVKTYGNFSEEIILTYASALEAGSNHVLARAIVTAAENRNIHVKQAKQIVETAGRGLSGRLDGKTVLIGRFSMMQEQDIKMPKSFKETQIRHTSTLVAVNGTLAGIILFEDTIRPEAKKMLAQLRSLGIKHIAMVTGDNETTALRVGKELDIDDIYPNSLPSDKLLAIEGLPHWPIIFVGDGVNDAPVLTAADVGIALGARGSTAASESADVVIMLDDVSRVSMGFQIARNTFHIAKQSILIGILLSLGLMAVFATGRFKPIQGALIQEVVDVIVIFNALRAHGTWKIANKIKLSRSLTKH